MATIKPFSCFRPSIERANLVASLPYDVYNRQEAKEAVEGNIYSFLNIDRPETQFPDDQNMYAEEVYQKAATMLQDRIDDGTFIEDNKSTYYIYELIMNGRHQTGIVACSSIDDYLNNVIKKHENTREEKEIDRIKHISTCNAQTGPIFLAYRTNKTISEIVNKVKTGKPLYSFTSSDNITHNVWKIEDDTDNNNIFEAFKGISDIYIADGHHRAASAVKVGVLKREACPNYTGEEDFNFFLSVLFPEDQLMIMPYNRVVADLNGLSEKELFTAISESFIIEESETEVSPSHKGEIGMYLNDVWYKLTIKEALSKISDPVQSLDVSLLQNYLLDPILGIKNPRTDNRIDFVGGIRGNKELVKRTHSDMKIAFSMYPTSISELFSVSDAGKLMPPKSTWFEPKLRSGFFIHKI